MLYFSPSLLARLVCRYPSSISSTILRSFQKSNPGYIYGLFCAARKNLRNNQVPNCNNSYEINIFKQERIDLKENLQKIVVILLMDQDEIFVRYEIMTFEKVYQENYNQLIYDKTYELYNDLNMVYCLYMYEIHQHRMKEYSNVRN